MKKQKIALTGRLRVGKDYIASQCGGTIVSFAEPLYILGEYLTGLGPDQKDNVPFLRELYQKIGQWGRGDVNEQYPLCMERCLFAAWVKAGGPAKLVPWVDWSLWGAGGRIWLDALLRRADELPDTRIFVSNCRFENEYRALVEAGWDHWHVLCSRQTYEERLRPVNLSINSRAISDVSEALAAQLDNAVINAIKTQPVGPKLKAIWNDNRPTPCERLQSVESFQHYLTNQEVEPEYTYGNETEPATEPERTPAATGTDHPGDARHGGQPQPAGGAERKPDRDPAERRRSRKSAKGA